MEEISDKKNIFEFAADPLKEIFDVLHERDGIRVERIVSTGQSSPEGFWYDQDENEWVCLIEGDSTLEFEDGSIRQLSKGDHLVIPAHLKHRVKSTSQTSPTIWIAVFYR